jgi:RNA polymerase sigma-70 factor, ECF subfamily
VTELGERFEEVLAAAVAGDQQAFGQLWTATHPPLMRYLRVLCGQAAEDVASEAWLKAIHALGSFQGDEKGFRGWLVVIARNHVRDLARRTTRRPEILAADPDLGPAVTAPDTADLALANQATRAALRLVASLPAGQAEMVTLRVIVGLDVADVAAIVGRSSGAVRVAVHRALRTLADRLTDPVSNATEMGGVESPRCQRPHHHPTPAGRSTTGWSNA